MKLSNTIKTVLKIYQKYQLKIVFGLVRVSTYCNILTCLLHTAVVCSISVPSAAPANFILSSSSPLSLTASWDAIPVKQQQGKLLGYQVFYKKEGSGNEQNGTVGPDQLNYTIIYLELASYSVRVAGFTAVGIGNSTVVVTKTPNEGG